MELKVKTLNEQVATLSLENNQLRTDLSKQEADNKDITEQLRQARSEKDKVTWEKDAEILSLKREIENISIENTKLLEKIDKLGKDITTLKDKNTQLKIDLVASKKESIKDYNLWSFIKYKYLKRQI